MFKPGAFPLWTQFPLRRTLTNLQVHHAAGGGVQPEAVAGRVDDLLHLQARIAAHEERGEALASRALSSLQQQQWETGPLGNYQCACMGASTYCNPRVRSRLHLRTPRTSSR